MARSFVVAWSDANTGLLHVELESLCDPRPSWKMAHPTNRDDVTWNRVIQFVRPYSLRVDT